MKGCIFEANFEGQGWETPFCCFWPGGWDIFEKEETPEKGCVEIEDGSTSIHFVSGFQENSMRSLSAFL